MSEIDRAIEAMGRISLLAQLRDKVVEAQRAGGRSCGNCYFWMKSRECPREHNVNGMTRGPNCDAPACDKFQITRSAQEVKASKIRDAIAFAHEYDLPTPSHL